MEVEKQLNIKLAIIKLKILYDGNLAVIDEKNTLRVVDLEKYAIIGGFKSNISHDRLYGDHVDVDDHAKLSASILPGKNKAALFSVPKKKILYQIGRHRGDIESVAIDPNLNYIVTAGTDGKTFAWSLKTARLAFTMFPHSDYVTSLAFSNNAQWLATGSFDKTIHVLHVATMKMSPIMHGHSGAVRKIIFIGSLKLVSADKNGLIIISDRKKGVVLERLKKLSDEITTMCVSSDENFLFVGTKLGYIALYDLTTYEQLSHRYIKESSMICSLAFIENGYRLAVGCEDGNLKFYSLFGDEKQYDSLIAEKRYEEFYKYFQANPLLRYSNAYKQLHEDWLKSFEIAKKFLQKSRTKDAEDVLKPFVKLQEFTKSVQTILRDFKKYDDFLNNVKTKKYPLAYSIITQFPVYKESREYKEMEKEWKTLFNKASEYILKKDGEEIAKKLLEPFRGISQKTVLIKELFDHRKKYLFFKQLLAKKDYFKVFRLIQMHPFLKEFPEYDELQEYADQLYIKAYQAYSSEDFITTEKLCKILVDFPDYKDDATDMLESINRHNKFLDAIEKNKLELAFEYLDQFPLLYDTAQGKIVEEKWNEQLEKARKYASSGDTEGVKKSLKQYLSIKSKKDALATVFKQSYMKQLDNAIKNGVEKDQVRKAISRYIATFGIDDFIELVNESFISKYNTTLNLESFDQGVISSWVPKSTFNNILG